MEKEVKSIVKKVREMYKDNERLKNLISSKVNVTIIENDIGEFEIHCLLFDNNGWLFVYKDNIKYTPLEGENEILAEYESFDELLKLNNKEMCMK